MQYLNRSERQLKYLSYLNAIVFLGYLSLALVYLFELSARDVARDAVITAQEFTPVFIVAICYFVLSFTCGEFFGLLRYQFSTKEGEVGSDGLRLFATRSLSIFFMITIGFYFLRAGLKEGFLEKLFFIVIPVFLGSYLVFILKRLNEAHMMAPWYFKLKSILLYACILGQLIANIVLFFPEILATIALK